MITQSEIPQQSIVFQHIIAKLRNLGLVLKVYVAFQETLVQLDNLTEREVLARRLVQPASRLNELPGKAVSMTSPQSRER